MKWNRTLQKVMLFMLLCMGIYSSCFSQVSYKSSSISVGQHFVYHDLIRNPLDIYNSFYQWHYVSDVQYNCDFLVGEKLTGGVGLNYSFAPWFDWGGLSLPNHDEYSRPISHLLKVKLRAELQTRFDFLSFGVDLSNTFLVNRQVHSPSFSRRYYLTLDIFAKVLLSKKVHLTIVTPFGLTSPYSGEFRYISPITRRQEAFYPFVETNGLGVMIGYTW